MNNPWDGKSEAQVLRDIDALLKSLPQHEAPNRPSEEKWAPLITREAGTDKQD